MLYPWQHSCRCHCVNLLALQYLFCCSLLLQPDANSAPTLLLSMLTQLRDITDCYPPPYVLWTLFITACIAVLTVMLAWPESQRKVPESREIFGGHETHT